MRRRRPEKRTILPDPIYNDLVVAKFINYLMIGGKKSVAERIFYNSLEIISSQLKTDAPIDVFKKALTNVAPMLEVKSKRIGGATYQVPMEVRQRRSTTLAIRWMVDSSRKRGEKTMSERLGREILDASNKTGASVKKREDVHKMAESNRAFAHYRW